MLTTIGMCGIHHNRRCTRRHRVVLRFSQTESSHRRQLRAVRERAPGPSNCTYSATIFFSPCISIESNNLQLPRSQWRAGRIRSRVCQVRRHPMACFEATPSFEAHTNCYELDGRVGEEPDFSPGMFSRERNCDPKQRWEDRLAVSTTDPFNVDAPFHSFFLFPFFPS